MTTPQTDAVKNNINTEPGPDRITNRAIWRIAGPAVLANSAAPLVGLVDTAVMGHLPGPEHLAAIGIGSTFFTIIFWLFGFLRMGTTGLTAQAHGASNLIKLANLIVRSSALALGLALLLIGMQDLLIDWGLALLNPPISVIQHANLYMAIRIWSAPFTLFGYVATGVLIGLGRTDQVLALQLVLNGVNLGLNLLFVLVFNMGVAGLALGTLIAEAFTAILAAFFILKSCPWTVIRKEAIKRSIWNLQAFQELGSINGFIFLRTLMLIIAFSMLTRTAASMGPDILAASQILLAFSMLISLGLDGVAYAAETLTGQAIERCSRSDFRRVVKRTGVWAGIVALLYTLIFLIFGDWIVSLLTDLENVHEIINPILPLLVATPLIAVASYQFDGIFIGATAAKAMAITMGISLTVYVTLLSPLSHQYGLGGLWGCLLIFLGVRGLTQFLWLHQIEKKSFQTTI